MTTNFQLHRYANTPWNPTSSISRRTAQVLGLLLSVCAASCVDPGEDGLGAQAEEAGSDPLASAEQKSVIQFPAPNADKVSLEPRITGYGLYARDFTRGAFSFCGNVPQANGASIDLRDTGCAFRVHRRAPSRYFASVSVSNSANEPLTYDWKLYVRSDAPLPAFEELYSGSGPTFEVEYAANTIEVTTDCFVTVTVNAPDPSRSKTAAVWSGKCTYYTVSLR